LTSRWFGGDKCLWGSVLPFVTKNHKLSQNQRFFCGIIINRDATGKAGEYLKLQEV
jgi:hypothetical protein